MRQLQPLFLDLANRDVLLVGGGRVAAGKLRQLMAVGARVLVVAPLVLAEIDSAARGIDGDTQKPAAAVRVVRRGFQDSDLDGKWLVVAAATRDVNAGVARAAESRHIFVNAVDDPENASAFLSGVVRRDDVTIAISTSGDAPALTALVREALDAVLPGDLDEWMETAREERLRWREEGVPMEARRPRLLRALNELYGVDPSAALTRRERDGVHRIPWLSGPEDSWL